VKRLRPASALLLSLSLFAGAIPAEAANLWRPKRQVRSLEASDGLGQRLFGKTRRRGWRAAERRSRADPTTPVDVKAWLSRFEGARPDLRVDATGRPPE
jgi:hypothetical protein